MIRSFADKKTAYIFTGGRAKALPANLQSTIRRKLKLVDAAGAVEDLRIPPGNRLEKLGGDRAGLWSIRINDQWRICFRWQGGDAYDVQIVDYH